MSTFLITGATGGLGSSVIKALSKDINPNEIAVLVRDAQSEKAHEYKAQGFDLRIADYNDADALTKAFQGIEILYFVSANDIFSRDAQHKNVIEAAEKAKIKHVIYTSAGRKDESQESPVAAVMDAHIKTEKWLQESEMLYTILRHNLYTEVVPMFLGDKESLLNSKTVFLPTGEGKTAFASRNDLAEAGAFVLKNHKAHQNNIYTLDGLEAVDFTKIAAFLSEITREEISYISPDVETFKTTMTSYGVPKDAIGMMLSFSLGIAQGEFDSERKDLEKLLGRKPQALKSFLSEVYA